MTDVDFAALVDAILVTLILMVTCEAVLLLSEADSGIKRKNGKREEK